MPTVTQEINVPSTGATVAPVTDGGPNVRTVYSDAGLTTPFTLPATLQPGGTLIVYVPAGAWESKVTAGAQLLAMGNGLGNAGTTQLVFTAAGETVALEAFGVDGGTP